MGDTCNPIVGPSKTCGHGAFSSLPNGKILKVDTSFILPQKRIVGTLEGIYARSGRDTISAESLMWSEKPQTKSIEIFSE